MSDLLDALNDEQRLAVENFEGYVRLHAGAGTGKTRTLTYRYAYLVSVLGIPVKSVWCCTFTNKAANEMKERIISLCGEVGDPFVSTFHSFCVSFLKEEIMAIGWPKNFTIWDVTSVKSVLRTIYEACNINGRDLTIAKAWEYIDGFKEEQDYIPDILNPDTSILLEHSDSAVKPEQQIFWRYLFAQRTAYALDFDDLILFTLHILRNFPEVRARWQDRLEYIMVDEFQDIDRDQYELVEILAGKHHNLFIVGDPDQTIYSWRGARVSYFNDFILRHGGTPQEINPLETEAIVMELDRENAQKEAEQGNTGQLEPYRPRGYREDYERGHPSGRLEHDPNYAPYGERNGERGYRDHDHQRDPYYDPRDYGRGPHMGQRRHDPYEVYDEPYDPYARRHDYAQERYARDSGHYDPREAAYSDYPEQHDRYRSQERAYVPHDGHHYAGEPYGNEPYPDYRHPDPYDERRRYDDQRFADQRYGHRPYGERGERGERRPYEPLRSERGERYAAYERDDYYRQRHDHYREHRDEVSLDGHPREGAPRDVASRDGVSRNRESFADKRLERGHAQRPESCRDPYGEHSQDKGGAKDQPAKLVTPAAKQGFAAFAAKQHQAEESQELAAESILAQTAQSARSERPELDWRDDPHAQGDYGMLKTGAKPKHNFSAQAKATLDSIDRDSDYAPMAASLIKANLSLDELRDQNSEFSKRLVEAKPKSKSKVKELELNASADVWDAQQKDPQTDPYDRKSLSPHSKAKLNQAYATVPSEPIVGSKTQHGEDAQVESRVESSSVEIERNQRDGEVGAQEPQSVSTKDKANESQAQAEEPAASAVSDAADIHPVDNQPVSKKAINKAASSGDEKPRSQGSGRSKTQGKKGRGKHEKVEFYKSEFAENAESSAVAVNLASFGALQELQRQAQQQAMAMSQTMGMAPPNMGAPVPDEVYASMYESESIVDDSENLPPYLSDEETAALFYESYGSHGSEPFRGPETFEAPAPTGVTAAGSTEEGSGLGQCGSPQNMTEESPVKLPKGQAQTGYNTSFTAFANNQQQIQGKADLSLWLKNTPQSIKQVAPLVGALEFGDEPETSKGGKGKGKINKGLGLDDQAKKALLSKLSSKAKHIT